VWRGGRQFKREAATCATLSASVLLVLAMSCESIGSPVSLAVERKPSKYDWKKKLITSLTNRKSEIDLKCVSILPKTEWLADVCYDTQLFHRLVGWLCKV